MEKPEAVSCHSCISTDARSNRELSFKAARGGEKVQQINTARLLSSIKSPGKLFIVH